MKLTKLSLVVAAGVAMLTTSAVAAGPAVWPTGFPTRVKTEAEVMKCCLPKEKVALACKDCKTANAKSGEDKKAVLGWFKAGSTHQCAGCGGKITVKALGSGKGPTVAEYKHTCSKCGAESAYTCATHKT